MQRSFPSVEAMIEALEPSYPVYCLWPAVMTRAVRTFVEAFPGRVLYAVKCNPHPAVLRILHEAGIRHYDTASLPEIAALREAYPNAMLYFMHPVKSRAAIQSAYHVYGVRHFVVDHPNELGKVLEETQGDGVAVLVRIATPQAGASYDLSAKFGARPAEAVALLKAVHAAGCRAGLAFHVGSQCLLPSAYRTALDIVGEILAGAGIELTYLDVGGGFPGRYEGVEVPPLEAFLAEIESGIGELGLRRDCVVMCEPGRALVASGCSLVVQIQLRKADRLYINDGIYGSLSEMVTAGIRLPVRLIRPHGAPAAARREFTVYGPTCDSTDVLPSGFHLPEDACEGDWIEIAHIGAYSNALATHFNGFFPETFVAVEPPR